MTVKQNIFSGGTPGVDVTPANSGGGSGDAFDLVTVSAGTLTYSTDHTIGGTRSGRIVGTGSGTAYGQYAVNGKNVAQRGHFWLDAATTTDTGILWMGVGSTQVARLQLISNGKLRAFTTSGTIVWTSTNIPATSQWVRFEMRVVVGTSSTTGEIHGAYYLGNSTTPAEEFHLTGQDLGTANVTSVRFGKATTSSFASTMYLGAVKTDDATTSFIGPLPSTPPTVVATGADAYLIDATASTSSGSPTYSITQTDGPTLAPVLVSSGVWRVSRGTSTRSYDVSVTDSVGTSTLSITVPVVATSSAGPRIVRRRLIGGVLQ